MKLSLFLGLFGILVLLSVSCILFSGELVNTLAPALPTTPAPALPMTNLPLFPVAPETTVTPEAAIASETETTVAPETAIPATTIPEADGLNLDMLKNFTYIFEYTPNQVPLQNGEYEWRSDDGVNRLSSRMMEPVGFGDLNGDGHSDAAVAIGINTGGTGFFILLVAVIQTDWGPTQAAYVYVDDRAAIRDIQIEGGKIKLSVVVHGPNDGLCCPSQPVVQTYELRGQGWAELVKVDEQPGNFYPAPLP